MGRFQLQWIDSTQERATVSYPVADAAADGLNYTALQNANLALRDAILALQVAPALLNQQYISDRTEFSPALPTNPLNQVEQRWIVQYTVNGLTGVYTAPIPCADLSQGIPVGNRIELDITGAGTGLTLKSNIESTWFVQDGVDAGGTGAVTVSVIYAENS